MKANLIRLRSEPDWRQSYGVTSNCKIGDPIQKRWTVGGSGCSVSRMWKTFAALMLLATPVFAQERVTAYDALRVLGVHSNRDAVNHIVSITGAKGDPQPETWRILVENPGRGGVHL